MLRAPFTLLFATALAASAAALTGRPSLAPGARTACIPGTITLQ